jgi:thiol-disulfide isomerase/thioredoxin
LTAADLRGHVVLINFWTYTCINWLRTLPYVRAWADKYKDHGLVVIGVHTPEFDFEHDLDNVRRAVTDLRVDYPVAVDSDYAIWNAFGNRHWPAFYFVDAQGEIRHHRFGEGEYEMSEMILQQLLAEAGSGGIYQDLVSVDATGVEAAADWASLRSPENYLGSERTQNFALFPGAVLGSRRAPRTEPTWTTGQRHGHRAAPVPARPPARLCRRAHLRGHLPGSWRPGLRLHLRLGRGHLDSWLTDLRAALAMPTWTSATGCRPR